MEATPARTTALNAREVNLTQRLAVERRVVGAVVGDEVLRLSHYAFPLRRDDKLRCERPGEHRVFTERL